MSENYFPFNFASSSAWPVRNVPPSISIQSDGWVGGILVLPNPTDMSGQLSEQEQQCLQWFDEQGVKICFHAQLKNCHFGTTGESCVSKAKPKLQEL